MAPTPDAIQAQLIVARRNQILDAATKVFAEKGFHPTTIKDIARVAGIADGTIYNYFENKTGLMLGIFERLNESDRRSEDLSKSMSGDIRSFMQAYLRHRFTVLKGDNFEVFRVVVAEVMVNKELRELFNQRILEPTFAVAEMYFQDWVEQHKIEVGEVGLILRAIAGMVLGLVMEYVMGDALLEEKWEELPDFLTDKILLQYPFLAET